MKKRNKKLLKIGIPVGIASLFLIILCKGFIMITKEPKKKFLETIDSSTYAYINHYAIYGIHLNIEGTFTLEEKPENISLVLANGKDEIELPWETTKEENNYTFKTSEYINEGINLEKLPEKELYLLIKAEYLKDDKTTTKYYSVKNNSEYKNLEYYTIPKNPPTSFNFCNWLSFKFLG